MGDEIPIETAALAAESEAFLENAPHQLRRRILSGSAIMLLSSGFVSIVNLVYNFAIAHALGAGDFGHASVVYTLLMLLSSFTLSFQLICSKYVAKSTSMGVRVAIYRLLHRWSWGVGVMVGAILALISPTITRYLNLPNNNLILTLAAGIVFYIPLGARRGFMQGNYDFWPLAINFALEVIVKLIATVALISAGVEGVVGATSISVILAYFFGVPRKHHVSDMPAATLPSGLGEGLQAITFFVGQVVINNLDIVLVKHFFDATAAGIYAVVALVGRLVYMLSWSVVSSMFPFSAGVRSESRSGGVVLRTALLLVIGIGIVSVLGARFAPLGLWHLVLGHGFPVTAHFSKLLALYAATTAIYCVGIVIMTYEISRRIGHVSWVQLAFSGTIILGIYWFHGNLEQVIGVQFVLKSLLLLAVFILFLAASHSREQMEPMPMFLNRLRKVGRLSENEVVAEFLRSEFYQEAFSRYRKAFAELVEHPNLCNERDNALRRALLFHRRGRLWRELPADTEWWEVELTAEDVKRVRVFARNQWLRYAPPGFLLLDVADRIRERLNSHSRDMFINKLRSLSQELNLEAQHSSVILISVNETSPLTILEGNHRMTTAALVSPQTVHRRFRFICGFSPRMSECCWYRTDLSTLWRYALNTLEYYVIDRRRLITAVLKRERTAPPPGLDAA
jgi:O-antigen/teichoic acid export membrane protein